MRTKKSTNFYPRPPRGGRRRLHPHPDNPRKISIHALREEGDGGLKADYPALKISIHALREEGDQRHHPHRPGKKNFYPRPPRGGRRKAPDLEGTEEKFLSTPSARRATRHDHLHDVDRQISIHALREEGDAAVCPQSSVDRISIHALREEGDPARRPPPSSCGNFYPRPPRGGRPSVGVWQRQLTKFLSTPSARRATSSGALPRPALKISIHALREEGDKVVENVPKLPGNFYPRPPRGGRHHDPQRAKGHPQDFYPRPPRGGRQQKQRQNLYFLINYTTFCTNLEEP